MSWTRRDSLACLLLASLPFLFFAALVPFWPGPQRFFPDGDFVDQFYAFARFETQSFLAHKLPLWNPFAYAGSPFWADIQSAVAYPPSLAVTLTCAWLFGRLPFLALELEAVAHLALAGLSVYLFARRALASRSGAFLSGLVFSLGGYLTGYPPLQLAILETDVWLPLALLGAWWTARASGTAPWTFSASSSARGQQWAVGEKSALHPERGAVATLRLEPLRRLVPHPLWPIAWALAILAGHPQSALYVVSATAFYWFWQRWIWLARAHRSAPWACPTAKGYQRKLADLGQLVLPPLLAAALALGASAVGWLPAWQYWRLSNRLAIDFATAGHGFPPRELLGLLLPRLTHWAPLYVGLVPLGLALTAAWRALARPGRQAQADRFWIALGVTGLFLSLGSGSIVFAIFYRFVPMFGLFRGQERAAFWVSFSLAMLAGRGLAQARRARLNGFILGTPSRPTWRLSQLLAGGRVGRAWPNLVSILLVSLTAADLFANNGRRQLVASAPSELERPRWLDALADSNGQRLGNEDRLPANFGVLHAIESTSGASPLRLRSYDRLRESLVADLEPRLWDLWAVGHVLTARSQLSEPSIVVVPPPGEENQAYLHRLRAENPRAWWVPEAREAIDEAEALALLSAPEFDVRKTVVLSSRVGTLADRAQVAAPQAKLLIARPSVERPSGTRHRGALERSTAGPPHQPRVEILALAAGHLKVRLEAPSDGWLVVSEMAYPGWQARLDGQPAPLRRADVALMALAVPAGRHEVELSFRDPLVGAGAIVSLFTALALALLATRPLAQRGRSHGGFWLVARPSSRVPSSQRTG